MLAHSTDFSENLSLNRNVTVVIKGGQDCDFGSTTGWTTLNGVLTVGKGSLTVDKLIIK